MPDAAAASAAPPPATGNAGLLAGIRAFALEEPGAAVGFVARLARENRWTRSHAARVVEEYRRFMFLAVAAGHPVAPSDAVDQAWHLHLLQTRSYWDRFCPLVLGRRIHHEPSRGGRQEAARIRDWYARTLASYRRLLGEPPPDIWPEAAARFAGGPRPARIDLARHWVIRKPWAGALRPPAIARIDSPTGGPS
ncbi:MAG: hypothetical protein U1E53_18965 [Dongiaceae bacterium]